MTGKAPTVAIRKDPSISEIMDLFPDNTTAVKWFEKHRWPDGPFCPHCGSFNVQSNIKHPRMTHRCRDCPNRAMFTLRVGTLMESTKLDYQTWAIAIHLATTSLKGISSMKLHHDLKITPRCAWHLINRLCKAYESAQGLDRDHEAKDTVVFSEDISSTMPLSSRSEKSETDGSRQWIGARSGAESEFGDGVGQ